MIESPTYRRRQCEVLFNLYLTRNLVHDTGRTYNKELQCVAASLAIAVRGGGACFYFYFVRVCVCVCVVCVLVCQCWVRECVPVCV